jgi:hypothetical protein
MGGTYFSFIFQSCPRRFEFMKFSRIVKVLLVAAFIMALSATAQWSPGGMMAYMGDLNLASPSAFSGAAPYAIGNAQTNHQSLTNNSSANSTSAIRKTGLIPLDLSKYAGDRINKSLEGYTNIIYPITESAGFTASTAAGGSSGGCGCG